MASEKERRDYLKEIASLEQQINKFRSENDMRFKKNREEVLKLQQDLVKSARELKKINQSILDGFKSEESSISSIASQFSKFKDQQKEVLSIVGKKETINASEATAVNELLSTTRDIADLTNEDNFARKALINQYNDQLSIVEKLFQGNEELLSIIKSQFEESKRISMLSKEEKELLEKQRVAQEALDSSMKAISETVQTFVTNLASGPGITGLLLIGAGKFASKLSEANKELGQVGEGLSGAAGSASVLSFAFDDSVGTLKALSAEMGGLEDATFGTQLQTNLMANNLGISGAEAATLSGSLARLNDGSLETAGNLAAGTREFARMNNIPVSQLMGDVAGSAEEFALFGKDGGKNILQAAGYAAKLGTNMATISGIADNLLDFESSINKELELGAMLGKNINLDRARALAMEGDLEGATKATLDQLGGIEAFNEMDYFQKKATADLLGVSVAELGKMATNQEKAAAMSKTFSGNWSNLTEGIKAAASQYGPKLLEWSGGFLTLSAQAGQTWTAFGGGISKTLGKLKGMLGLGKKAAGAATSVAGAATESVASNVGKVSKGAGGGIGGMMKGVSTGFTALGKIPIAAIGKAALIMGVLTLAIMGIGQALKIAAPGIESIGNAIGTVVNSIGGAVSSIIGGLGDFFSKIAAVATPELALSVLGLAGGFAALTASLSTFAIAGLAAVPAMMAVSAFGAASSLLGLGGEGGAGGDSDLLGEIRGLREDLNNGKVAVYLDGKKVTAGVARVANASSFNSYSSN